MKLKNSLPHITISAIITFVLACMEVPQKSRRTLCQAKLSLVVFFLISFFGIANCTSKGAAGAPVISSPTTASGVLASAFSYQMTATNAPTLYGATGLPAGLTPNTATGLISGTPTAAGTYTVTLSATNSSGTGKATLKLTTIPTSYLAQATANHAIGAASTFSLSFPNNTIAGDVLLVGLDFTTAATLSSLTDSQGNNFTEVGTQLTSPGGARSRLYYARNIVGGADTVKVVLSAKSSYIEVYLSEYYGMNSLSPLEAGAGAVGNAGLATSGNATTTIAGDVIYGFCIGDIACTVGSGFAARSTFDGNLVEDMLAGNPGPYAATGSASSGWTMQMVALKPALPAITSASTASAMAASTFSYQIVATGAPTTYGATGLPSGLTLNTATGLISGAPTAAGTYAVTLSATNATGTGKATLAINVLPTSYLAQATAGHASGSASTFTLSFPNNTLAGDIILVGFDFTANATLSSLSDSQGNTFTAVGTQLASPGGAQSRVYYAQNIKGGADTVTVNLSASSGFIEVYLTEYYGINPTSPIDAQAGAAGNAGLASSGNGTTTLAGDVIYGYCVGDIACAAGANFAPRSTFDSNLTEDMTAGNPGVYAATGSASSGWTMQMVALKPVGSAGKGTPAVSLSATSLAFAGQAAGSSSAPQIITVTNSGSASLSITGIGLSGTNASDFVQSNSCGSSVAAGASCAISVAFKPAAMGIRTAAVSITDNASGGLQTVSITGTGTASAASLSPASLTFAGQAVGATGAAQNVTLTNSGNATLSITSVALSGTNASDFAQTNNCAPSVAAGASCVVSVTFKPTTTGTRTAAITFTDNASGGSQTAGITGTGTAPSASVSPASLTFASQTIGVTSAAQIITLRNSGNATLSITSIALSGTNASDFTQTNTCGSSVAAGANCAISVTFKPAAAGTRIATVIFTDNATGGTQTASLTGIGTTAACAASVSPTSLTFASQAVGATSAVQTATLTNSGNAALNITSIALSGANAGDFAKTTTCGSTLAASANCTISVTFTPSASGARAGSITITDSDASSPQTVSLSGTGTSTPPTVSFSPNSLTFSNASVAMTSPVQTVTLTNTGTTALNITGLNVTGANAADFAQNSNCGNSVAAGTSCTIAVTFTPSAAGTRTATLSIADNASGSPQSVILSGSASHDVMVSWSDSPSAGVTGYYIYRGTAPGAEGSTPVNCSPINVGSYMDENVTAGATYYYVIMSLAADGVTLSAASTETQATVPTL
jgi:hypothetical protein